MKEYSKFNTDRKGNQIALTITRGSGRETEAEAILHEGDALEFCMDKPALFGEFFECKSLDDVVEIAERNGWKYVVDTDSPLRSGIWK